MYYYYITVEYLSRIKAVNGTGNSCALATIITAASVLDGNFRSSRSSGLNQAENLNFPIQNYVYFDNEVILQTLIGRVFDIPITMGNPPPNLGGTRRENYGPEKKS